MQTKTCRSPPKSRKLKEKEVTFDDGEFDVIESEADSVTSEESSEEDLPESDTKEEPKIVDLAKEEKKIKERVQKINSTKVGIKEFLQVLDYQMLALFAKSLIVYFIFAAIFCCIYLTCVYHFNKALWHEYFPVEDISDILEDEEGFEQKDEL